MTGPVVHIVGAGLAGLSAAVNLVEGGWVAAGRGIRLYEGSNRAGGRARSYHDQTLDRVIDNGSHLMLSANGAVLGFLEAIGASDRLDGPDNARFDFVDLDTEETWSLTINDGRFPWWVFDQRRRVPGTSIREYLDGARLMLAKPDQTIGDCIDTTSSLFRRLWEPIAIGVMNAAPEEASAALLGRVLKETFGRGGAACRPLIAKHGLADTLVDPALAYLAQRGIVPEYGRRLRALERPDGTVTELSFANNGTVAIAPQDRVILALPAGVTGPLVDDLTVPSGSRAIVNAHFRVNETLVKPPRKVAFLGMIGTPAQWLFLRDDIVSVTVSAADELAEKSSESIASLLWPDVNKGLRLGGHAISHDTTTPPPFRIVKEKRATILQSPQEVRKRPSHTAAGGNLLLSGDWTDTGLPATIEGAIRSGRTAANAALHH